MPDFSGRQENTARWPGGVAVERWTCDQEVVGSMPGHALSGNNSGQVVNTHVPLFTKHYNLVPCVGFMLTHRHVAAIHGSNEQGSIVVAVSHCSHA